MCRRAPGENAASGVVNMASLKAGGGVGCFASAYTGKAFDAEYEVEM